MMEDKKRILIIDDSEVVLAELQARLSEAGYQVVTTSQIVGAGRFLRGTDVVILDFHMPGMDGAQVLRSLRAACREGDRPAFYLYTTDAAVAANYRSYGFDGALSEKGDYRALLRQLQAAFRILRLRPRAPG